LLITDESVRKSILATLEPKMKIEAATVNANAARADMERIATAVIVTSRSTAAYVVAM